MLKVEKNIPLCSCVKHCKSKMCLRYWTRFFFPVFWKETVVKKLRVIEKNLAGKKNVTLWKRSM